MKEKLYAAQSKCLILSMDNKNLKDRLSKYEEISVENQNEGAIEIVEKEKAFKRANELIKELSTLMKGLNLINLEG